MEWMKHRIFFNYSELLIEYFTPPLVEEDNFENFISSSSKAKSIVKCICDTLATLEYMFDMIGDGDCHWLRPTA